jgi:hypothetical protein
MKINELIQSFEVWTSIEERALMAKLKEPRKLSSLSEHDQFKVQAMIRKSLITKIGMHDPSVVANEKIKQK